MKAIVRPDPAIRKGQSLFRVVDEDDPEGQPILNKSGEPIDGGGHRREGISQMLADEVNEAVSKRK